MALPILPNPSNFLGVALVINRSRDGPRFVFHYPSKILPVQDGAEKETSEDDLYEDIFADRASPAPRLGNTSSSLPSLAELARWNHDDHLITESGTQVVPWEYVAGFPTKALEGILTPARAYHKSLFQVSLDPVYCVSYPIYAPETGIWRKKKKKKQQKPRSTTKDDDQLGALDSDTVVQNGDSVRATEADQVDVKDMARPPKDTVADEAEDKVSSMTMFNLVFILNPKKHESRELIDTMYSHIIKKVNKVYKYCQQRSDFVWKESKRILTLKDKAQEDRRKMSSLWNEILGASSLAASMKDVYDTISQNKIAVLQLDAPEGMVTHSVQIPIPFHMADLPEEGEEAARGLWITTANSFANDDTIDEPVYLDKNFALLLMYDEKKIVSELQADPDDTTLSMIEFVKHSKPTLSFYQVAQQQTNHLTLGQVRKYAEHFIFWRRAIAIPPLHMRDTYILSPNCDMTKLPEATTAWTRTFPVAPSLPDFLNALSTAPRPYKAICPNKSYRPQYLLMLAWLMRGGWVTQLCTFAYVVVWPEILYEVDYALEADEIAKAKRPQQQQTSNNESSETASRSPGSKDDDDGAIGSSTGTLKSGTRKPSQQPSAAADSSSSSSHPQSPSPPPPPYPASLPKDPSTTDAPPPHTITTTTKRKPPPTPAEQAVEAARLDRLTTKAARDLASKATAHARKAVPTPTAHPAINDAAHLAGITPHLILDARKPTGRESLYLSAIGRRLAAQKTAPPVSSSSKKKEGHRNGRGKEAAAAAAAGSGGGGKSWDERVAESWPVFWQYFNGRSALERIALQEEMKRKDVWNLLTAMSEYLHCVRHW